MKLSKDTIKDVLKLALPAVGEMTLYMMIWVFDTMMVGKYGGNLAVSSVGLSSEIIYTFSNILIACGLSIGITSLVARKVGAKEYEMAEEYATLGFLLTLGLALLLSSTLFIFASNIFKIVGAEQNVIMVGSSFMRIASIGTAFSMSTNALNATLRGSGNTKLPLLASIIINIINLSLDYLLIFGKFGLPQLGVKGAAIATSTAQIIGFIFIAFYMSKHSKIKIRLKYIKDFDFSMLKGLFKLSIPSAMQEGAFSISRLLGAFFIVGLGTVAFAANQITSTIESISFMPGWGFAVAATTLVGHKIGEKNYKKAKEYAFTSIFLGTLIMTICAVLFLTIPNTLIKSFITSSESEVIKLGTYCLMIAAIEQPFIGISMIVGAVLKGSGDTKTPFKVSLLTSWGIRMPLMIIIIFVLKLSVVYVWVITSIQWAFDGIIIYYLFRKKAMESLH